MSKFGAIFSFAVGAVLGGAVGWFCAKQKFTRMADEEIKSVKEVYKKHMDIAKKEPKEAVEETPPAIRFPNEPFVYQTGPTVGKSEAPANVPYIISPEDFGEIEEYEKISLYYFADGVLTDDNYELVDDVEEVVGNAPSFFGNEDLDDIYVRNDAKRCDYELLRDLRIFSEFRKTLPRWHSSSLEE